VSNQNKEATLPPPGPLIAHVGPYSIHDTQDDRAPPGAVEVFAAGVRVIQTGPLIRELVRRLIRKNLERIDDEKA
jgi:hypothetical protein